MNFLMWLGSVLAGTGFALCLCYEETGNAVMTVILIPVFMFLLVIPVIIQIRRNGEVYMSLFVMTAFFLLDACIVYFSRTATPMGMYDAGFFGAACSGILWLVLTAGRWLSINASKWYMIIMNSFGIAAGMKFVTAAYCMVGNVPVPLKYLYPSLIVTGIAILVVLYGIRRGQSAVAFLLGMGVGSIISVVLLGGKVLLFG